MKAWTKAQLIRVGLAHEAGASWQAIGAEFGRTPEAARKAYFRHCLGLGKRAKV